MMVTIDKVQYSDCHSDKSSKWDLIGCTKFHGNECNSRWHISLKTTGDNFVVEPEEKSEG